MSERTIGFELRLSVRWARWLLAAIFVVTQSNELASESVTLTTYYPAPSGVYTQAITTSYAYFARDGGGVSIGTTDSVVGAPNDRMIVNGNVGIHDYVAAGTAGFNDPEAKMHIYTNGNSWSPAASGGDFQIGDGTYRLEIGLRTTGAAATRGDARISVSGGGTQRLILGSNNGATDTDTLVVQPNGVTVNQLTPALGAMDVNGVIISRTNNCTKKRYMNGLNTCATNLPASPPEPADPPAPCVSSANGCYVSMASGMYLNRWELGPMVDASASGGAGTMLCCPRPTSGNAF